jgi:hypothetical protein
LMVEAYRQEKFVNGLMSSFLSTTSSKPLPEVKLFLSTKGFWSELKLQTRNKTTAASLQAVAFTNSADNPALEFLKISDCYNAATCVLPSDPS